MGVLVGVHDELDAALNAMLLALIAKSIVDFANDDVDIVTNVNDGLNHTMVHIGIFNVNRSYLVMEDGLITSLHKDGIDHTLNEADVIVNGRLCLCVLPLVHGELCLRLLEHLLLLACDTLAFYLFLLPYLCLVFRLYITTALTAPALSLLGAEFVSPAVSSVALNDDDGSVIYSYDLHCSVLANRLATNRVHNLDAVVAETVLAVHEIPEFDIAAMACLLLLLLLLCSNGPSCSLLLATVLNSATKTFFVTAAVCNRGSNGWANGLSVLILSGVGIRGDFSLLGFSCHRGKVRSVHLCSGWDLDSNFSEDVVDGVTLRLMIRPLSMRMMMSMMIMMGIITLGVGSSAIPVLRPIHRASLVSLLGDFSGEASPNNVLGLG